jgi:diaminopimelate decarboxylase
MRKRDYRQERIQAEAKKVLAELSDYRPRVWLEPGKIVRCDHCWYTEGHHPGCSQR